MNRLLLSISLAAGMFLMSCNNWLDISPRDQILQEEAFESQSGFEDALTGVYIQMCSEDLYGGTLVWGNIERLAQHWEEASNSQWAKYNYADEGLRGHFSSWYRNLYYVIANANVSLEEIDAKKEIFEPGCYELIKGELLGIRAFCHFDLLRLFGPVPGNVAGGKMLPYVKTVGSDAHPFMTYVEYTAELKKDLEEASALMKEWDPVRTSKLADQYASGLDDFWETRQVRMNYFAVTALQARFYLWTGDMASANACAREVIGDDAYTIGTSKKMNNTDFNYSLEEEHIFAMSYSGLYDVVQTSFGNSESAYSKKRDYLAMLFDGGKATFDIRFLNLWQDYTLDNGTAIFTTKKFWQPSGKKYGHIPLIRLSEMYFIAMESGTLEQALELLGAFYPLRGLTVPPIQSQEALKAFLLKEYNREFYAEGQGFYAYKRMNATEILWSSYPGGKEVYVLPLPDDETIN